MKLALQLYTVREALAADFDGTIRRIAALGYAAVETAGFAHTTPKQAKALFDSLQLQVTSAHSALPLGDQRNEVLDTVAELGCPYLVCPWLDPDTYFQSLDGVQRACELLNEANQVVQTAGLKLAYHNHWFEMAQIAGKPAYQHMVALLEPTILFELDIYWVKVGGFNPVDVLQELQPRVPLLHIKDGPAINREDPMTAVGAGTVDIPAVLAASSAEWHVVELDRCATDMLTAVHESYTYLQGLPA